MCNRGQKLNKFQIKYSKLIPYSVLSESACKVFHCFLTCFFVPGGEHSVYFEARTFIFNYIKSTSVYSICIPI